MLTLAARQRFGFNQRFRQQGRLLVVARHFTQVSLFDVIQIFLCRCGQPFAHSFIGKELVLQDAHFRQRFPARGTTAGRHHGKHVPAGDGGEMREAGEALEGFHK